MINLWTRTSTYIDKLQSLPYDLFTSCWKKSLSGLKLNSFEITSLAHLKLASCPKVAFCYLWGIEIYSTSILPHGPLVLLHLKALPSMLFNLIGIWFVIQKGWTTMRGALIGSDI